MWQILDYLMNQKFCDESTIRGELGRISKEFRAKRCVLMVHRREEIVRSLAIVHDDEPEEAKNLENWLYKSAHGSLHDFTSTLRRLAFLKRWVKAFHEWPQGEENDSETIYRDENEAVVIELFLRNAVTNKNRVGSEAVFGKEQMVRVIHVNEYCLKDLRASYDAYIILIKNSEETAKTQAKKGVKPKQEESLKQLLDPISTMIACSAPVIVQDRVDTHVRHKGSIGDLLNIQIGTSSGSKDQSSDDTGKQHLRKALETFRMDRMERGSTQAISDLTILAYNDSRKAKSKNLNDTSEADTEEFDGIEVDTGGRNIEKQLVQKVLQCRSPKFAMARQRPLLFCRRTSTGDKNTDDKTEYSFEFSVQDIEMLTEEISSLLVIPYESLNIKYLLIAIRYLGSEIENESRESFFDLDDLSLGNDILRVLSWNFQREKERLAFGKLKQMLRDPISILQGEEPSEIACGASNAETNDEAIELPHEYRKVGWAISDLIQIAQEATSASAIRLSFLNPIKNQLTLALALEEPLYGPSANRTVPIDLTDASNYSRCLSTGDKIYDADRLDELNPFYNSTLVSRSEVCLPIFVYGFVVGILELNHESNKGFSKWEDFLDLICIGISHYLALAKEDIDSELVSNLGDSRRLAHLRNKTIRFLKILDDWNVIPEDRREQYVRDTKVLREEADATTKSPKTRSDRRKVSEIAFQCGTDKIPLQISLSAYGKSGMHDTSLDQLCLTTRANKMIDKIFQDIAQNITTHSKPEDTEEMVSVECELILLGGQRFLKIAFKNPSEQIPSDSDSENSKFQSQVYREPFDYAGRTRLGCYVVGRIVRDCGGDIYGEFSQKSHIKSYFTTHLLLPVSSGEHHA